MTELLREFPADDFDQEKARQRAMRPLAREFVLRAVSTNPSSEAISARNAFVEYGIEAAKLLSAQSQANSQTKKLKTIDRF